MNRLPPSTTYSSPSRRAVVRIAALSEPEPGSVSAYAASHSPLASRGRYRCFCSSLPASLIPSEPSSCTATIRPLVAHTFDSSSIVTSVSSELAPMPPCSSSYMIPKRSLSRNSSTTSHGNSAVLSISAARGPIFSRASARTRLRISRCSSVSGSSALTRRSVRLLRRPASQRDLGGAGRSRLADERDCELCSRLLRQQQRAESVGRRDGLPAHSGDHVTRPEPGGVGGSAWNDGRDHRAAAVVRGGGDLDAEEGSRADVDGRRRATYGDLLRDRQRLADRDCVAVGGRRRFESETGSGRGVHADHPAGAVDERAAGVARLQRGIRLEQAGEPLDRKSDV